MKRISLVAFISFLSFSACTDQLKKREVTAVIENQLDEEVTIRGFNFRNTTPPDTVIGTQSLSSSSRTIIYSGEIVGRDDFYPTIVLSSYLEVTSILDSVSMTFANGKTLGVNRFSDLGPLNILDDLTESGGWRPVNGEAVFTITQVHKDAAN